MCAIQWPSELQNSDAAIALQNALANQRLGHGLLLVGSDQTLLDQAAVSLATALLGDMPNPDYKFVEPTNKLRQIGVEGMRELRIFLQTSSNSGTKVAHLSQADRLNRESANLFLKSLEEPPEGAFIIMTSTQPHAILPTLLSRVMRFRLNADRIEDPTYGFIVQKMAEALHREGVSGGERILEDYAFLQSLHETWTNTPTKASVDIDHNDMQGEAAGAAEAREAAALRSHRSSVLAALQQGVWEGFRQKPGKAMSLVSALKAIEVAAKFMNFSLNEAATLEVAVLGALKAYRS